MGEKYALIEQVRIEQVTSQDVTFSTRSASLSGDPDECLLRTFTCSVADVWTHPIAGAPSPVAMKPGAVGSLYLSARGLETRSPDGYRIYGVGTPILRIKYPDNMAGSELLGELRVTPSSIVVRGLLKSGTSFVEIDLLGPEAASAQEIVWNNVEYLKLHLTPAGAQRLNLPAHATTAEVWPTAIRVTGRPASDPTVSGTVDLLNSELAAHGGHRFAFARHGAPITLSLTQDGFAAFHVTPGLPDAAPERQRISRGH